MTRALERARKARLPTRKLVAFFERARIEPVLTAHPTEVQRKSILDRHQAITAAPGRPPLAARRGSGPAARGSHPLEDERASLRQAHRGRRDRKRARLFSFHLSRRPAVALRRHRRRARLARAAAVLPAGRQLDRRRSRRQPARHPRCDGARREAPGVGGARSLPGRGPRPRRRAQSCRRATPPSPASCETLAERAPDRGASRNEELFRRALVGIYARLVATARELEIDVDPAGRPPGRRSPRLCDAGRPARRPGRDRRGPARGRAPRAWPAAGLRALRRAVDVFGFHLASLDLRQHSDVHGRVVAEIFARATGRRGYDELPEPERQALLLRELSTARPLVSPHLRYSDEAAEVLATVDTAARLHARFGARGRSRATSSP